jgi:hypothetical protein
MSDPTKVRGFLDFFGAWDESLAFVMLGAISVHLPYSRWLTRRAKPRFAAAFSVPPPKPIDRSLVIGSALFGLGWGVTGYCPAPAIVSSTSSMAALLSLVSMVGGLWLHEWWAGKRRIARRLSPAALPDATQP